MRTFQLAVRGLPDLRNAPQTMDFTMRGQTFTADVTPDPDGGSCATVRGRGDGFTGADPAGTAQGHAEVAELMVFGAGRPNGPSARFHVGTLRREIPFIPKTTAGTWLGSVVGADVPGGPPPARDVRQSDLVRGGGRARETRAPTMTFARAKNLLRSTIPE